MTKAKIRNLMFLILMPIACFLLVGIFSLSNVLKTSAFAISKNGGCFLVSNNSTFNMTSGSISGGKAENGGGVYVSAGGTFNLSGGTIFGNTATTNGNNVYNAGTFLMTGGTVGKEDDVLDGYGIYNYGTMKLYEGTIYDNILAEAQINVKVGLDFSKTIYLGANGIVCVENYDDSSLKFGIAFTSDFGGGDILILKGASSKPDLSKFNISYDPDKYYLEIFQSGSDWIVCIKRYILVTVSTLSGTTNEGTVMGSGSCVWQKKCKVGDVINFTHEPNGNFGFSKLVHGYTWTGETIDEDEPYTISGESYEENFTFCYVVLLYLNTVTNGENGNGDGGLCTVYDGQTPKTEANNGWAYYGPNQKTQCTAVPNYGYTLEGVYDNSSCTGTPVSTDQSFEWTFGSYGYQRLYANFVNSPILLPSTWKSQVESETYMTKTISYGDISNLKFTKTVPSGYVQIGTLSTGLKVYKKSTNMDIAFVYPTVIMAPEDSSGLFQSVGAKTITFENFDTSNATNMNSMFLYSGVTSLDLSGFNTSKVTDMSHMFESSDLTSLNISSLNTSNVTDMYMMFAGLSGLTSLDLSNFDTSNVTNMKYMFYYLSGLEILNLSSFNTSNVEDMSNMFQNCKGLTSLTVSSFNTQKVTTMESMFQNCSSLTSLSLSKFNTEKVENMRRMFSDCSSLKNIYGLAASNSFNTQSVTTMERMFQYCSSLTSLSFGENFVTSNVVNMRAMFDSCVNLTSLYLNNFDTGKVTDMSNMFDSCASLKSLNCSSFNMTNVSDITDMFKFSSSNVTNYIDELRTPYNNQYSLPITTGSTLYNKETGEAVSSVPANTTESLTYITAYYFQSDWKTELSNSFGIDVTEITSLRFVDFVPSGFSKVGTLSTGLSVYKGSTSTDIAFVAKKIYAPSNCSYLFGDSDYYMSLKTIILSVFDTKGVTDMNRMFFNCEKLTSVTGINFDTSSVKDMSAMFYNCSSLTRLDLSSFNLSAIGNDGFYNMLYKCSALERLYAPKANSSYRIDLPKKMYYYNSTTKKYIACEQLTSGIPSGTELLNYNPDIQQSFIYSVPKINDENVDIFVQDNKKEKLYFIVKIEG